MVLCKLCVSKQLRFNSVKSVRIKVSKKLSFDVKIAKIGSPDLEIICL